jgi:hypothetical protein
VDDLHHIIEWRQTISSALMLMEPEILLSISELDLVVVAFEFSPFKVVVKYLSGEILLPMTEYQHDI